MPLVEYPDFLYSLSDFDITLATMPESRNWKQDDPSVIGRWGDGWR